MTLRQTVDVLRNAGIEVDFRVRPDGGIVITKVGSIKYSGRAGNEAARNIAGTPMSMEARAQRSQISRTGTKVRISGQKLTPIPNDVKKELRRIQGFFRKQGVTAGKPTTANIRFHLNLGETKEQIFGYLSQAERYAKGLALIENLEALKERAFAVARKTGITELETGANILEEIIRADAPNAYNEQARDAHDYLYECEEYADRDIWEEAFEAALSFLMTVKEMQ